MSSSPVFDNGNDSIGDGEGGNGARVVHYYSGVDVKYFVCALAVSGWAKEYSWECAGAHCVCDGWIVMSFDVGSKGCFVMFFEVEFATKDNLPRGVLVGYPGCGWDAIEP